MGKFTHTELKQAYANVILEGEESELAKLWRKHFPGRSLKIPLRLTEERKHNFRCWAKGRPGWHCVTPDDGRDEREGE